MTPHLSTVECAGLKISTRIERMEVCVTVLGSCDSGTLSLLERFLGTLHDDVVRIDGRRVVLFCEELYFMNSASLKCFVTWLAKVKALPPTSRYRVAVRTNPLVGWQRRSFASIARSAPEVFTLEP